MKYKKIVLAGGTGFIGQAMARYFGKDNHMVIRSREAINGHNNRFEQPLLKAVEDTISLIGAGMESAWKNTGRRK